MNSNSWIALALVATSLGSVGCSRTAMAEKPPTTVSIAPAALHVGSGGQRYTATIEPETQLSLAFKTSGYVERISQTRGADGHLHAVQTGDFVRSGTVLAVVRQGDYAAKVDEGKSHVAEAESSLASSEAQVAEAAAAYERAKLDFERASALFAAESMTKPDFDAAKAQRDTTKARLDAAQSQVAVTKARISTASAQLRQADLVLRDTAIAAPMDCVVLRRTVEVGSLVSPGAEAFALADTSSVKAVFGVPDVSVHALKPGDELTVTTEALADRVFRGRVSSVAPSADPKSRVFNVEVTIPNEDQALKAGMIASLVVADAGPPEQFTVVALNAVVRSKQNPDGYAVFVVEDSGDLALVHERQVTLGAVFGSEVVVTGGVKVGDRVVATGATLVQDGERVRVVPN